MIGNLVLDKGSSLVKERLYKSVFTQNRGSSKLKLDLVTGTGPHWEPSPKTVTTTQTSSFFLRTNLTDEVPSLVSISYSKPKSGT